MNKKNPLISVVTISFNQASFLEKCIKSVITQSYKNYEYIIVDPGSTDGSREIIKKYKKYFAHVIFEKDNGPANGLNKGFQLANGEILYFINSDDFVAKDSFLNAIKHFKERNIDLLLGSGFLCDKMDNKIKYQIPTKFGVNDFIYNTAVVFQQGMYFKKDLFNKARGFNEKSICSWDGELLLKMILNSKKIFISYYNYGFFRIYDESGTGSGNNHQNAKKDRLRIMREYKKRSYNAFDEHIYSRILLIAKFVLNPKRTIYLIYLLFLNKITAIKD